MSATLETLETVRTATGEGYKYGFITDIESDEAPPGLNEDTVRFISAKKGEPDWLLEWRLKAFRRWQTMTAPNWSNLSVAPIDYQGSTYHSAPKPGAGPKSLDEVDPELLQTYEKLGIPLGERAALAGIAVDAVFDSVSVATMFKDTAGRRSPGNTRAACWKVTGRWASFIRLRSLAITNNRQQADTGTKMIHLGKNTRSTVVSKGISAGRGQNTYRGLIKVMPKADGARNYTEWCDSLLIGKTCGAHTVRAIPAARLL